MFSIKYLLMNCSDWQVYKKGIISKRAPHIPLKVEVDEFSSISREDVMFVGIQILIKQSLKSSISL